MLLLQFTITGRCLPWVHMPQINGVYSPMVGYAYILKKLTYQEFLSYHVSQKKGGRFQAISP
jgi:hypothetical protein